MTKKGCTFFGHRDCPYSIQPVLNRKLKELITVHHVEQFYVGTQGKFDDYVYSTLQDLKKTYACIECIVVLAYLPKKKDCYINFPNSIFPEGLETVPPKYAIYWRNKWMLKHSDFVITYVNHNWGGAAKFAQMAKRQGKRVINLSSVDES